MPSILRIAHFSHQSAPTLHSSSPFAMLRSQCSSWRALRSRSALGCRSLLMAEPHLRSFHLHEYQAMKLAAEQYRIPTPPFQVAVTAQEAEHAASELGQPTQRSLAEAAITILSLLCSR